MTQDRGAPPAATTDAERAQIDSGQMRDKIAFPDPAAAPLGTDAEAGGAPASRDEIRRDQRPVERPPSPEAPDEKRQRGLALFGWGALIVLVLGLVFLFVSGSAG